MLATPCIGSGGGEEAKKKILGREEKYKFGCDRTQARTEDLQCVRLT